MMNAWIAKYALRFTQSRLGKYKTIIGAVMYVQYYVMVFLNTALGTGIPVEAFDASRTVQDFGEAVMGVGLAHKAYKLGLATETPDEMKPIAEIMEHPTTDIIRDPMHKIGGK